MNQQRGQGEGPHSPCPLDREPVAAAQDDPGIQRQGRANGVGQLLARLRAQLGEFRSEHLEGRGAQSLAKGQGAFDQGGMAYELAGSHTQRHDPVKNLGQTRDHGFNPDVQGLGRGCRRRHHQILAHRIHDSYEK